MNDAHTPDASRPLGLQGPHWQPDEAPPLLRLVLQPQGFRYEITQLEAVIGRHSEADVRLAQPDVSRRHCRLVCTDGRWEVFDLNSLNGVYLNGERVQHARLFQNDLLQIGNLVLAVDFPNSDATANYPSQAWRRAG